MPSNIFKAIKNAGDAFLDTLNSKPQTDDDQLSEDQQPESNDSTVLSPKDEKECHSMTESDDSVVDNKEITAETDPTDEEESMKKEKPDEESKTKAETDLDKPEIRLKTSEDLSSGGYVLGFSIQGRSHIMSKMPCQDYHAYEDLGSGWLLAITSDGAGSAREAARGSKANCELALKLVKQLLSEKRWKEHNHFPDEKEWYIEIKNVFEVMQAIVSRSAASQKESYKDEQEKALSALKKNYPAANEDQKSEIQKQIETLKENIKNPLEPRDFNATLILLLISPQGMMAAHIGDGRMGYLSKDGIWKSLMTPHKGDEASSTVFIPNNWNRQLNVPAFTMSEVYLPDTCVVKELPKAFVLMSDGCESFSWTCKVYDKTRNFYYDRNVPYEKFMNPLIDRLGGIEDKEERINEMIDIINVGTTGGKRELDDRTMLLGVLE